MAPKLSIIIPVFNEKNTFERLLDKVLELKIDKEIVIIDDCSTDGSYEKLKEYAASHGEISLHKHEINMGKGACIIDGFKFASGDIAIIQDADLEYNPQEIPRVIAPIQEGYADVVYGSRFAGHPRRALYFWHSLGNKFLTMLSNMFTNLNLTDMETCYKAFRKLTYKNLKLTSKGFDIEPEITAKVARMRQRVYEVPISYRGRSYQEGKKINWKDGIKAVYAIVKHSLFSTISDDIGFKTLETMNACEPYNKLLYKNIENSVGNRIIEVGSGIGNITKYMLDKEFVLATDISESYLNILKNSFENSPTVEIVPLNLNDFKADDFSKHACDTIVCLNVLEHIEDDTTVLKKFHSILPNQGKVVLLVPAHQGAFGTLDARLGHFRRYSKENIFALADEAGFTVKDLKFINIPGLIAWFISGKIFRRESLSKHQMKIFNLLIPFVKLEKLFKPQIGLSIITTLQKNKS